MFPVLKRFPDACGILGCAAHATPQARHAD